MSYLGFTSMVVKAVTVTSLATAAAVGTHHSAEAILYSQRKVESATCHNGGGGHDDRGHDSREHGGHGDDGRNRRERDDRGHDDRDDDGQVIGGVGMRQIVKVLMPPTAFLRVDGKGRVTAAATNTGCAPTGGDEAFIFHGHGTVERTTKIDLDACHWTGDFTIAGQFQPQDCH